MTQESLSIKNFGPIQEVKLQDIKPFTVIIGSSGTGKSTIMKVLSLFRWLYKMEHVKAYLKLSGVKKLPSRLRFSTYIKEDGIDNYFKHNTEIVYKRGNIELRYADKRYKGCATAIGKEELHLEKVSFICDSRIFISNLISDRIIPKNYYLRDTLESFEDSMKTLESYTPSFFDNLNLSRIKDKNGKVSYRVKAGNGEQGGESTYDLDLKEVSSGTQSSLPMMAICRYYSYGFDLIKAFNDAIFRYVKDEDRLSDFKAVTNIGDINSRRVSIHIEEPELSLSPEKQRQMLDELVDLCFVNRPTKQEYDMGIMLTTHSPYIVNQLNLLIRRYETNSSETPKGLNYNDLEVYRLDGVGRLYSLKSLSGQFIDTMPLSDDINAIYDEYDRLG